MSRRRAARGEIITPSPYYLIALGIPAVLLSIFPPCLFIRRFCKWSRRDSLDPARVRWSWLDSRLALWSGNRCPRNVCVPSVFIHKCTLLWRFSLFLELGGGALRFKHLSAKRFMFFFCVNWKAGQRKGVNVSFKIHCVYTPFLYRAMQ